MSITLGAVPEAATTHALLLRLLRVRDLLRELCRFLVEILQAGFAAELHFATFVREHVRRSHVSKLCPRARDIKPNAAITANV